MSVATTRNLFGSVVSDPTSSPDVDFNALTDFVVQWNKPADDAAASTATAEHAFARIPSTIACQIISAYYGTEGTITANDTSYATLTVSVRDGAGGSAVAACSQTTKITGGSGDVAAYVPQVLTLDTTKKAVAGGSVLTFLITKASSGVVVPAGFVTVHLRRV